jgi:hypothetical protein
MKIMAVKILAIFNSINNVIIMMKKNIKVIINDNDYYNEGSEGDMKEHVREESRKI